MRLWLANIFVLLRSMFSTGKYHGSATGIDLVSYTLQDYAQQWVSCQQNSGYTPHFSIRSIGNQLIVFGSHSMTRSTIFLLSPKLTSLQLGSMVVIETSSKSSICNQDLKPCMNLTGEILCNPLAQVRGFLYFLGTGHLQTMPARLLQRGSRSIEGESSTSDTQFSGIEQFTIDWNKIATMPCFLVGAGVSA